MTNSSLSQSPISESMWGTYPFNFLHLPNLSQVANRESSSNNNSPSASPSAMDQDKGKINRMNAFRSYLNSQK